MAAKPVFMGFFAICFMWNNSHIVAHIGMKSCLKVVEGIVKPTFTNYAAIGTGAAFAASIRSISAFDDSKDA